MTDKKTPLGGDEKKKTGLRARFGAETPEIPEEEQQRRHRRNTYIRMIVLSILVIILIFATRLPERLMFLFNWDGNVFTADMTDEERRELLQKRADESQFGFSINSRMEFEDGSSAGIIFLENPGENDCLLKVVITLDIDGRVLYESDYIKPGQGIGKDKLKVLLPKGEYAATAAVTAYDDRKEEIGTSLAGVTITVKN